MTFTEAVDVAGSPQLEINVGGTPKTLDFSMGSGGTALVFAGYTVLEGDEDPDGISIDADSLSLNGGTIKKAGSTDNATLTHSGAVADAGQIVDGVRPTLVSDDSVIAGEYFKLEWSEGLDALSTPPDSAFTVDVSSGTEPSVSDIGVFGDIVAGELDPPVGPHRAHPLGLRAADGDGSHPHQGTWRATRLSGFRA